MPSILSDGFKYVSCPSRGKIKLKIGTYTPEHFSKCKHTFCRISFTCAMPYLHIILLDYIFIVDYIFILDYIISHEYYDDK